MSIEAMKQALDALTYIHAETSQEEDIVIDAAIAALRAAIEQAEKPVAWRWKEVKGEFVGHWVLTIIEPPPYVTESMPLYAAPRQWVGLTDEEIVELIKPAMRYYGYNPDHAVLTSGAGFVELADAIEAKLKEKNAA
jgi:hypothetical protein